MIRVTVDAFSGLPNPSWVLTGEAASAVVRQLSAAPEAAAAPDTGYGGLGFRGVIVEFESDTVAERYGVPPSFRLAGGASRNESKGIELAEQLIRTLPSGGPAPHLAEGVHRFDKGLADALVTLMAAAPLLAEVTTEDKAGPEAAPKRQRRKP